MESAVKLMFPSLINPNPGFNQVLKELCHRLCILIKLVESFSK